MSNKKYFSGIFLLLISLTPLAAAYISELGFGLDPCILCLYQRIPYVLIAAIGLVVIMLEHKQINRFISLLFAVAVLLLFSESGLAFYHVGVEQHWWASVFEACKMDFGTTNDPSALLAQIEQTQAARCDEIAWQDPVIGLSMAGWNVVYAAGMGILTIIIALKQRR